MLIKQALQLPKVVVRSLEAFRANDPVTIGEGCDEHAVLVTQVDPKLGGRLGLEHPTRPIQAIGPMGILHFYSLEMSTFEVTYLEVMSAIRSGRDIAAVCEWGARMKATGEVLVGRCHNIWTLDSQGRKLVQGHSVCKIMNPGWEGPLN